MISETNDKHEQRAAKLQHQENITKFSSMCFHDFQPKCVTLGEDADFKVKITRWNVEKNRKS